MKGQIDPPWYCYFCDSMVICWSFRKTCWKIFVENLYWEVLLMPLDNKSWRNPSLLFNFTVADVDPNCVLHQPILLPPSLLLHIFREFLQLSPWLVHFDVVMTPLPPNLPMLVTLPPTLSLGMLWCSSHPPHHYWTLYEKGYGFYIPMLC